jgi:hypothetical protein
VYLGLPAVLFLGAALWVHRRHPVTWKVAGLALFVLALTMPHQVPLYGWFYKWLPLWNSFRFPEKLLPYFLFPCALGAGAGLEAVQRDSALARRVARAGFVSALLCGLLALGEWRLRWFSDGVIASLWGKADPVTLGVLHDNFLQAAGVGAVTLVLLGAVLAWMHTPVPRAVAVLGLQFTVLYLANQATYHVTFPEVLEQPTRFVEVILQKEAEAGAPRPRVFAGVPDLTPYDVPEGLQPIDAISFNFVAALEPDTPALWDLESIGAYLPASSRRVVSLLTSFDSLNTWVGRLSGLYQVRYLTLDAGDYQRSLGNPDVVLAQEPGIKAVLLRNPHTLPRAYLATPHCVPDEASARALVLSRSFRSGHDVALECPPDAPRDEAPAAAGVSGQVRVVHYAPESVELEVEARTPAALVLNDAWYGGWSATVDGQPTPILPANVLVRGVRVPAGTHRVSFSYRTPGLWLGALISLGTLGLLGLAVLVERRKRAAPAG